jgi:hypothetical protein
MHGLAGSAALVLLTANTMPSLAQGIATIVVFGCGSVLGMALLSVAIAVPFRHSAGSLAWAHRGLSGTIGAFSIALGARIMWLSWEGIGRSF